jgi:hypothetical protein
METQTWQTCHAELGSASPKIRTHQTLKQVQGDKLLYGGWNVRRKFSDSNMWESKI